MHEDATSFGNHLKPRFSSKLDSKTTSLQITGSSENKKNAESTTVASVHIRAPHSSATLKGRKGNLNGSKSSLPLHEHRLRKKAVRESTNVSPSVVQLKINSTTLKKQVAVRMALRESTNVSSSVEQLRNNSPTLEEEMAVISRQLQSIIETESKSEKLTRSEKHESAADGEFIDEEIKKAFSFLKMSSTSFEPDVNIKFALLTCDDVKLKALHDAQEEKYLELEMKLRKAVNHLMSNKVGKATQTPRAPQKDASIQTPIKAFLHAATQTGIENTKPPTSSATQTSRLHPTGQANSTTQTLLRKVPGLS
uniref:HAUS augmin-like complex subunit 8 n=1 Tax=Angiostrongylus cantonensis TaxID=6313 RepID=A0A158PBB9_ANGCA